MIPAPLPAPSRRSLLPLLQLLLLLLAFPGPSYPARDEGPGDPMAVRSQFEEFPYPPTRPAEDPGDRPVLQSRKFTDYTYCILSQPPAYAPRTAGHAGMWDVGAARDAAPK